MVSPSSWRQDCEGAGRRVQWRGRGDAERGEERGEERIVKACGASRGEAEERVLGRGGSGRMHPWVKNEMRAMLQTEPP